ncbi:hypothetical protein BT69DRAFT_859342 [Atractiella rhizophila]|nr:hypothetical protein BT69DRAFT_859342 [Atractiella rhizophila]
MGKLVAPRGLRKRPEAASEKWFCASILRKFASQKAGQNWSTSFIADQLRPLGRRVCYESDLETEFPTPEEVKAELAELEAEQIAFESNKPMPCDVFAWKTLQAGVSFMHNLTLPLQVDFRGAEAGKVTYEIIREDGKGMKVSSQKELENEASVILRGPTGTVTFRNTGSWFPVMP